MDPPSAPTNLRASGQTLTWTASDKRAFCYRIYRSTKRDFTPGAGTLLSYVAKDTLAFKDNGVDLEGRPLKGVWYYRVTSADKADNESRPTATREVLY